MNELFLMASAMPGPPQRLPGYIQGGNTNTLQDGRTGNNMHVQTQFRVAGISPHPFQREGVLPLLNSMPVVPPAVPPYGIGRSPAIAGPTESLLLFGPLATSANKIGHNK